MSRELYVYVSNTDPVRQSDLHEAIGTVGWRCLLFRDLDTFEPLKELGLTSCWILGWEDDDDTTATVSGMIAKRDSAKLRKLYEKDAIGVVVVDLTQPYTPDPEAIEDLREAGVDPTHIAVIQHAKQFYSVRTAAGRNDASFELQNMVWTALGVAAYGLLEDPEEGTFEHVSKDDLEGDDE